MVGSPHCCIKKIATPIFGPAIWYQIKRSDPGPQQITDWQPLLSIPPSPSGPRARFPLAADDSPAIRLRAPASGRDLHQFLPATAANLFPLTSNFQRRPADLDIDPPFCHLLPISSSASIVDCTACEVFGVHSL